MTPSRLQSPRLYLYAYGTACALASAAMLILPVSTPGLAGTAERPAYSGPDHRLRTTGQSDAALPVHLVSTTAADQATVEPPSALPTLVGLAGSNVWLKSAVTGEVERIATGGELDGWRVVAVRVRSATLTRDEERETLELYQRPLEQTGAVSGPTGLSLVTPVMPLGTPPQQNADLSRQ